MHRILEGLPPYGPLARSFPEQWGRRGQEGFVVEFTTSAGSRWVGNFADGGNGLREVVQHPDGRRLLVISGGDGWSVDIDREDAELVATAIDAMWSVDDGLLLSRQGLAFLRLGETGVVWHTRRLSWDGFKEIQIRGDQLTVLTWSPFGDRWSECRVDLRSGASEGGSDADWVGERWEQLASS